MSFAKISIRSEIELTKIKDSLHELFGVEFKEDIVYLLGCNIMIYDASMNIEEMEKSMTAMMGRKEEGLAEFVEDIYSYGKIIDISPFIDLEKFRIHIFFLAELIGKYLSIKEVTKTLVEFNDIENVEYCFFDNGIKVIDLSERHSLFFSLLEKQLPVTFGNGLIEQPQDKKA